MEGLTWGRSILFRRFARMGLRVLLKRSKMVQLRSLLYRARGSTLLRLVEESGVAAEKLALSTWRFARLMVIIQIPRSVILHWNAGRT
jgi:hypothetical protein